MPLIKITQWPHAVESGRQRILEAALDAGIPFPHGCGTGECGTCKCRLLSGQVTMDKYSPDALSEEDHANGMILACRAHVISDVVLSWPKAQAVRKPVVRIKARTVEVSNLAHDIRGVVLELPAGQGFDHYPGQFASLHFGSLPARNYSMANPTRRGTLEFHVRVVPGGRVSHYVAHELREGDMVRVTGPYGEAHWEPWNPTDQEQFLLLAGGTGLAPIQSILHAALHEGVPGHLIHLYHGVRAGRDLYADASLKVCSQDYGFRYVPVFSESPANDARQGMLHHIIGEDFRDLSCMRIFVAGPPPMVDAIKELALQRGATSEQIRADPFHAARDEKAGLLKRLTRYLSVRRPG